jgi:hypothetical protein
VSNAIAERASAIRHYLSDRPDRALVRRYSFLAARFEELRLQQHDGKTTPADDNRLREVSRMLGALTRELGLGDDVTDANGYLPRDPQRLLNGTSLDCLRLWFE